MSAWTRLSSFQNMPWFFSKSNSISKPFNSHIKFVILLTDNHTYLTILVWRIESCPHLQHNTFVIDRESKLWGNHIKCYKFSLVIWNLKKKRTKRIYKHVNQPLINSPFKTMPVQKSKVLHSSWELIIFL